MLTLFTSPFLLCHEPQVQRMSAPASDSQLHSPTAPKSVKCQCFGTLKYVMGNEFQLQTYGQGVDKGYSLGEKHMTRILEVALGQVGGVYYCVCHLVRLPQGGFEDQSLHISTICYFS